MAAGPLNALRRVSARSLGLLLSRVEFGTLELAQARAQLVRWLALALVCSVIFQLALLAASAALVVVLWDRWGPFTLVALALVYAGAGATVLMRLRREIAEAPPLLSKTLAELAKDRDALFGDETSDAPPTSGRSARSATTGERPREAERGV
jgi:uncharacterized membrane protein YqjE